MHIYYMHFTKAITCKLATPILITIGKTHLLLYLHMKQNNFQTEDAGYMYCSLHIKPRNVPILFLRFTYNVKGGASESPNVLHSLRRGIVVSLKRHRIAKRNISGPKGLSPLHVGEMTRQKSHACMLKPNSTRRRKESCRMHRVPRAGGW